METTFITIHDLSPEARILYTSDSIVDILGYSPDEVVDTSCWDYFHPDEIPIAQAKHGQGLKMDKAAVLSYCRMKDKDGHWLGCEVVFTIVFDVLVGCTSIYRRGLKSQSRAVEAPIIRRLFSTSPRDPRYHMLSHLSSKFTLPPSFESHEPRAALFLNRYTRTLTIMYATDGLSDVLGISGDEMRGKSFYYCIQENCLQDAIKCLENAKANDSIAYLRFWYRDPRQDDRFHDSSGSARPDVDDEEMEDVRSGDEFGTREAQQIYGTQTSSPQDRDMRDLSIDSQPVSSTDSVEPGAFTTGHPSAPHLESHASSGLESNPFSHEVVFGESEMRDSSASSLSTSPGGNQRHYPGRWPALREERIELEAVVSCTSDGLVVCLRRARAVIPNVYESPEEAGYANGLFAVPWGTEPTLPAPQERPRYAPNGPITDIAPAPSYHKPLSPRFSSGKINPRPGQDDLMNAIRDIAVFAWALVGINGSLAEYGHGKPRGESQPASGLPIWQAEALHQQRLANDGGNASAPRQDLNNNHESTRSRLSFSPAQDPQQPVAPRDEGIQHVQSPLVHAEASNAREEYRDQTENDWQHPLSQSPNKDGYYRHSPLRDGHQHEQLAQQGDAFDGACNKIDGMMDDMVDGVSQSPWQPRSMQYDAVPDKDSRVMDGVSDSPESGLENESRSSGARKSPVDPYGFGDPGLRSKGGTKFYNSALQNLFPIGPSDAAPMPASGLPYS